MYRVISVFVLCLCALTNAKFQTCNSKVGHVDVNDIIVTGCFANQNTCTLKRNTNVSIEFDFTINESVQSVNAVVHGILMNVPIPFPVPNSEVCEHSDVTGVHCPLEPNQGKFHYRATLPVSKTYPKVAVDVKWELVNEKGEVITCILIDARLK